MPKGKGKGRLKARADKLAFATELLRILGFASKQRNEAAGHTLLALLDLRPDQPWDQSAAPLRGITPIIKFIHEEYGVYYAPNSRESIRDEAVKYFAEAGLIVRNPDNPNRPTNSGKTVYQIEPQALNLIRHCETPEWHAMLANYLNSQEQIRKELERRRTLARIPVRLPSGDFVALSAGGQNPLIKHIVEEFCPRFVRDGLVVYIGDAEDKFLHLDSSYLESLGVEIPSPAKMY